ncbi:MAG: hypothetical protein ACR2K0_05075 [Acidimicrobiales bacterium]
MPELAESHGDEDQNAAWRQERLEGLGRLGGVVAALGWFAAFLGLLIAIRWQGLLSQVGAQPVARLEALAPPLLLGVAGVGLAGFGRLLRIVPVICGGSEPGAESGRPRSLAAFLRTMRSHQG